MAITATLAVGVATGAVAERFEADQVADLRLSCQRRLTRKEVRKDLPGVPVDQPFVVVPRDILALEGLSAQVLKELVSARAIHLDLIEDRVAV